MKLNKIIFICILLLTLVSLSAVSANDDADIIEEHNADVQMDVGEDIAAEEMQSSDEDKLAASPEDADVAVEVSDVFKGQNATISVSVPEATGTADITVGEKTYSPEFVGGVATQIISQYNIGLNNVTVKYNNIVKQTSFKGLDGVVTTKTITDYFEVVDRYYLLKGFIPDGATLDVRGYIYHTYQTTGILGIYINKPCNLISTTRNAEISNTITIQNTANNTNMSNMKLTTLNVRSSNCRAVNMTFSKVSDWDNGFVIENSTMDTLEIKSNSIIRNCTINNEWELYHNRGLSNVSVFGSTFKKGIAMTTDYMWKEAISNISFVNCNVGGRIYMINVRGALIEGCTVNGYLDLLVETLVVKNNLINASSSHYAVNLQGKLCKNCSFLANRIYSRDFSGNNAILYQYKYDINFYNDTTNVFKDNMPTQIDLNIAVTSKVIFYDENTTVIVNMPGIKGNVVFYFNNNRLAVVELDNGTAEVTIGRYELGINNITAVYEDLVNDTYGVNHTSFNVNKVENCPVELAFDGIPEEKISSVNVILPGDAKGTITFTLTNKTHSVIIIQDANGTNNTITVPALLKGNYTMSATFESIKYVTNSSVVNVNIVHIPVFRLDAGNVVMDYKDGSKYKVLLTEDGKAVSGAEIKITFNGKTTNIKTDKNGYAVLALDGAPKTYKIKAEYMGIVKSGKVTIKNILKAKNISKKKAKTVKFQATLKTSKGKAIAGKKITFKLKGKTYSGKTNKKGVATVTLKNLKVGKYTVTSKYGACTVKSTIKIRK